MTLMQAMFDTRLDRNLTGLSWSWLNLQLPTVCNQCLSPLM